MKLYLQKRENNAGLKERDQNETKKIRQMIMMSVKFNMENGTEDTKLWGVRQHRYIAESCGVT